MFAVQESKEVSARGIGGKSRRYTFFWFREESETSGRRVGQSCI